MRPGLDQYFLMFESPADQLSGIAALAPFDLMDQQGDAGLQVAAGSKSADTPSSRQSAVDTAR